ncbi:MAG: hypothetical protein LQ345_004125 [Seirophora villosa]|nr:MAG: hypothetical protein LQ345_004125 [Seirophora villosa]
MISRHLSLLLLWTALSHCTAAPFLQKPLTSAPTPGPDKLHGRFLHITGIFHLPMSFHISPTSTDILIDVHPDRFYSLASSTDSGNACHWGKGSAGFYGAENTDCDSPIALLNATFQWIAENLRDSIDFIVWTGDSARHDNDELIPRTEDEVIGLNDLLVTKFVEVFGKEDNINDTDPTNDFTIPIVPNFGNNDILPHNIFHPGPNRWTMHYAHVWRKFIPEEQRHAFERGGWFFVEVIPNHLAVFSLNTLYFFNNNPAADGCAERSEPGYEQFEWLRVQLQFVRQRGMKAILMGHVPPARTESKHSWDETCWQKYTLWLQQYRDVIVGGLYGHMNIDHFMLQDTRQLDMKLMNGVVRPARKPRKSSDLSVQSSAEYLTELREGWSQLPEKAEAFTREDQVDIWPSFILGTEKKRRKSSHERFLEKIGGEWGERYSATLVGASIVPNYYPTMRVFEYNTTGLQQGSSDLYIGRRHGMPSAGHDKSDMYEESKYLEKHSFVKPKPPSKSQPPGPAYSPQPLSLLGYTQLFANLTKINAAFALPRTSPAAEFAYELEYNTRNDSIYALEDLTMRNYINLAARIGRYRPKRDDLSFEDVEEEDYSGNKNKHKKKKKHHKKRRAINKVWFAFVNRAFVGAKDENSIRDQFGMDDD